MEKPYRGLMIGLQHAEISEILWLTADHLVLAKTRPRSLGGHRDWSASPFSHLAARKRLRREKIGPLVAGIPASQLQLFADYQP